MSRHRAGTYSVAVARPDTVRFGLRFGDVDVERGYRSWRIDHVRPFTRFAMYSAISAAVFAWVAVAVGALVQFRGLTRRDR